MQSIRKKLNPYANLQLRRQLYLECRAMAEYGLAKGKSVPPAAIKVIESFEDEIIHAERLHDTEDEDTPVTSNPAPAVKKGDLEDLVRVHELLVKIVEPASPKTILLLDMEEETPSLWKFFGPVPLVRHMMLISILCLLFFIYYVSQSSLFDPNASLMPLEKLLFWLASAGLGASFVALYSANEFITQGTFDPAHYASYWIRFLLGVMSGLVLAIVVSEDIVTESSQSSLINPAIFHPLMALLGGFSADLVYTLLNRLVETFKSLFQGSAKSMVAAQAEEARAKQESKTVQNRMKLAAELLKMQQDIGAETTGPEVQAKLNKLLQDLMPEVEQKSFSPTQNKTQET